MAERVQALVRVSGPPNSSFLVGYPGISATLVSLRINPIYLDLSFRFRFRFRFLDVGFAAWINPNSRMTRSLSNYLT